MLYTEQNELLLFIKVFLQRQYPRYIFARTLTDEIPVFIYHKITRHEFEERLKYLKDNNYYTLNANQLENAIANRRSIPDKSVVITFDDGLDDVYTVAYPLLKQFGFQAVVFLATGWIDKPGLLNWEQIQEMHLSGTVDFQSHSKNHPAIFCSDQLVDFYNPSLQESLRWNLPVTGSNACDKNSQLPELGTPIYSHASRFSNNKRFYPRADVEGTCIQYVANHGGVDFFKQTNWKEELTHQHNSYVSEFPSSINFETEQDQIQQISDELTSSKEILEQRLSNKHIRHFAWPWNQLGVKTAQLLTDHGYTSSFGGLSMSDLGNTKIKGINFFKRVSGDFIFCLPGKGRRSFWGVLLYKIARRLKSGSTY